ncbi:nucleotide-binding protein [Caballeronia sp. NK8]|uniref:TIR domain-containing protein n=1 Tax=Caballeronia sp. NK8 TaxID=140098 RepID=UPI001BB56A08|nr:TIR domain-containing protein [Caballeronia sp. NK8]BCQ25016.1 nucleotide-binding protein [Caballeronia sp. NK8]
MTQTSEVILLPDFGTLDVGGEELGPIWVIETPLKAGDFVMPEDTLITVESRKATLDVPSPKAGRVLATLVKAGDHVTKNTAIIEIEPANITREDFNEDHRHYGLPKDIDIGAPRAHYGSGPRGDENSVFLVHGHDVALREMSARLIEKLGLEAIILSEQTNRSATIIEKLERHSNVRFAVVLMTADDVGAVKSARDSGLQARARQNVVLELGYFIGKIGRQNVCVLYESGVELPSDYYGVVFIPIDDHGTWRYSLGKEFRQAGLNVDLNKL